MDCGKLVGKGADCGLLPSLGLSIDLSISVQSQHQRQQHHPMEYFHNNVSKRLIQEEGEGESERELTPLQLDLLPRPIAQKKNASLLWESLFSKSKAETSESTVTEAPNSSPPPRGSLDMNQIPLLAEAAEENGAISTSFQLMEPGSILRRVDAKRERESDEAEPMTLSSRAPSDEEEGGTRKKLRLSKEQSALLEESFREHTTLNPRQKNALAKQLNLKQRQVEVWFQNRRARTKLKQTEVDCELLKKYCEGLSEENRRLQKELQELRALKISPPCVITHDFYMPLPATTLTMCPSCERLATVDSTSNNKINNKPAANFHTSGTAQARFQQPSLLQPV